MSIMFRLRDSLANLVSGLGGLQDKSVYNSFFFTELSEQQLRFAYRGDWVARKAVDLPAYDSTKRWRAWQAKKNQIEKLEETERRLGLQRKTQQALTLARLFGGGAMVLGVDQGEPSEPLRVEALGGDSIQYINVVSRHEIQPIDINNDVVSLEFGEPSKYRVSGANGSQVDIDASRVVRFIGRPLPDRKDTASSSSGWGDSVLQAVDDAIKNVAVTSGAIATMVHESKLDVIKLPKFLEQVGTDEYQSLLMERFALASRSKSFINTLLLDKEEEWERISTNFTGLPDVLKLYLLIACGAVDIPATRFLGQSAVGLNTTGEGDLVNYYDSLSSYQTTDLTPAMSKLDEVLIRSALGSRDPSIFYNWNSLWETSEKDKAEIGLKKAQIFKIDYESALLDPDTLREARENQLIEDGTYPGLEIEIEEGEEGREPDDLDETDPDVEEQFAAQQAGGAPAPDAPVQNAAMNGAQIQSLMEIVTAVTNEELPPDAAEVLIQIGFPDVDTKQIQKMLAAVEAFEPKPKPVPPSPFGAPPPAEGADPAEEGATGAAPPFEKPAPAAAAAGEDDEEKVADAAPRTLYVYRRLLNAKDVLAHYEKQGVKNLEPANELHVTVMFTRTPVDWMKMGEPTSYMDPNGELRIAPGGPRVTERLGPKGAVVLHFACNDLSYRHDSMKYRGAEYDWPEYQPHVTVAYDLEFAGEGVEPWTGELVFGPEIFEEVREYAGGGKFDE